MKKILLVDDLDVDRMLTSLALERYHAEYAVVVARSCEEACQIVKEQKLALILVDVKLPVIGGLELLERLHFEGTKIPPCIVISSTRRKVNLLLAMDLGATDYIHKPLDYSVFKDELRAAFERNGFA